MNISGTTGKDTLDGGLGNGNDNLLGGAGNDTYQLFDAGDVVIEQLNAGIDLVNSSLTAYVLAANVENARVVLTTAANLTGNALNNLLFAGDGDNILNGLAGIDTVSYSAATAAVTVSLAMTAAQATGGSGNDILLNIENLTGGAFNDALTGNSLANVLDGGAGVDILTGGTGNDIYHVRQALDVVIESAAGGNDTVISYLGNYTLSSNVENGKIMHVGAANMTGNALANTIHAGSGNNVINGGAGIDTVSYATSQAGVTVSLALTVVQATGASGSDTLLSIEKLSGSGYSDLLKGNADANTLTGNAGNDTLQGDGGADVLVGGDGNDVLMGGTGNDTLTGGLGADSFDFTQQGANNGASDYSSIKSISDFVSGTDKLVFAAKRFDNASLTGKYVENLTAAASLDAMKLAAVAAHDKGAEYYFGVFGGNGYLFADELGDGWGDVIKLAGKTDMAATDIKLAGSQAGKAVIDLGADGKLIAPVQVEGKWYYHWDRSGDGTSADIGSLNGGKDYVTHDVLDGIFTQDINGKIGGGGNTTDTYRYATLNGVKLALPTANGGMDYPDGINAYQAGTSVQNGATNNPVCDELLAIWDALNGSGTGMSTNGTPSGWQAYGYWSATPSASGHVDIGVLDGGVFDFFDNYSVYSALQVL